MLIISILTGCFVGLSAYTFVYAKGYSYLLDDPVACTNCHIMKEQYAGYASNPHQKFATCNSCHTPPGTIGKYMTKVVHGWNHSYAFTTGHYVYPIEISKNSREVAENACRNCHTGISADVNGSHKESESCLRCHSNPGH